VSAVKNDEIGFIFFDLHRQPVSEGRQNIYFIGTLIEQQLDILGFDTQRSDCIIIKNLRIIAGIFGAGNTLVILYANDDGHGIPARLNFHAGGIEARKIWRGV
jgi:hypothetical protein